jgi:Alpha-kinase family
MSSGIWGTWHRFAEESGICDHQRVKYLLVLLSVEGKEYVITQPIDSTMSALEVEQILKAEYGLLCLGHRFIYMHPQISQSSNSRRLLHLFFIATPLLPCGDVDPKVQKFTGNDNIGDALDHMTKGIHAFAHFSVVYSHNNILLCDLQGGLWLLDPST